MVPRLTDLPVEIIARAAEFVPEKAELLALRCSAGSCKQAVIRAVKHHQACKRWRPRPTMPQNAATVAIGRVFGAGCRILDIPSHTEPVSAVATGLEPFLTSTGGLLTELYDDNNAITPDHLLILCRACPLLKRLGVKNVPNIQPADFVAVNQACPLLEHVMLPTGGLSPAETYARHFPRLRELKFTRESRDSQMPLRFDMITVAAETCVHVSEITCPQNASVTPEFVAQLLETPLRDRVTKLCFSGGSSEHGLLPETCLQLVRGFRNLGELTAPNMSALSPTMSRTEFFEQLGLAAPNLRGFFSADIDDECVRIICNRWQLEEITLFICHISEPFLCVTPAVVDIIVQSSSAMSLRKAHLLSLEKDWGAAELLGIVQGCPNLKEVMYLYDPHDEKLSSGSDFGAHIVSARRLLKSRGGKLEGNFASKFPPFF